MRISDWSSDVCSSDLLHRLRLFQRRPIAFDVVDRRPAEAARAAEEVGEGHLLGRRQAAGLAVAVGGDDIGAHHRVGPVELLRRLEAAAIDRKEPTSELQSLMRNSSAVFFLKNKQL